MSLSEVCLRACSQKKNVGVIFLLGAGECNKKSNRVGSLPVDALCHGVQILRERWSVGGGCDETTWRENLAGKEAQAAQCKKQSGKAVDCTPEQHFALQVGFISWNLTTFLLGFRTGMYPI